MTGSKLAAQISCEKKRDADAKRNYERAQKRKKETTTEVAESNNHNHYTTFNRSKAITKETRREAYINRPVSRANQILGVLEDREMTARQIMAKLGYHDMNQVRPRLTELMSEGKVEVVGKAYDMATKTNVSVYRRIL